MPNASNITRHYIIDGYLKRLLSANPDATQFLLAPGLIAVLTVFKGATWVEIDEPAVIEYKNEKLPVSECANPLDRIAIDFETEKLADKLSPYR
jgi:O-methyltransferase involved in polyketide biosynthesis